MGEHKKKKSILVQTLNIRIINSLWTHEYFGKSLVDVLEMSITSEFLETLGDSFIYPHFQNLRTIVLFILRVKNFMRNMWIKCP